MSDEASGDEGTTVDLGDSLAERFGQAYDDAEDAEFGDQTDDEGSQDDDGEADQVDDGAPKERNRGRSKGPAGASDASGDDQTFSQMRLNLSKQTRQVAEQARTIKELQSKVESLSRQGQVQDHEDVVDMVRGWAARRLGTTDVNDPRILEVLQDAAQDLTIEGYNVKDDPVFKDRAESRRKAREERSYKESIDRQFQELRNERQQIAVERQKAEVSQSISQFVESVADEFPFMMAAHDSGDIDHTELLMAAAHEAVASGQYPDPRTYEELHDLVHMLAKNVDAHYRKIDEAFSARRSSKNGGKVGSKLSRGVNGDEARSQERGKASTRVDAKGSTKKNVDGRRPVSGGGGKGRPAPAQVHDDGPDDLSARVERFRKYGR